MCGEKCDWREGRKEEERRKERESELVRGSENSAQAFPVFPCSSEREGQERGERESNEGSERVNESRIGMLERLIRIKSLHEWMKLTRQSVTNVTTKSEESLYLPSVTFNLFMFHTE